MQFADGGQRNNGAGFHGLRARQRLWEAVIASDDSNPFILSSEDLELATPYNTYVIDGLPAGPICNPSPAALQAALHPNQNYIDEGYLFFCSTDPHKGELFFSKTLEEHNEAVAMYKPLWEEYDAEQRAAREAGLAPTATPEPTSGT